MSHRRSSHRASGFHPTPSCRARTESEGKGGRELEQNSQNTQIEQIWSKTSACKARKMDFQTWGSSFWQWEITCSGNDGVSTFVLRVVEGLLTDELQHLCFYPKEIAVDIHKMTKTHLQVNMQVRFLLVKGADDWLWKLRGIQCTSLVTVTHHYC